MLAQALVERLRLRGADRRPAAGSRTAASARSGTRAADSARAGTAAAFRTRRHANCRFRTPRHADAARRPQAPPEPPHAPRSAGHRRARRPARGRVDLVPRLPAGVGAARDGVGTERRRRRPDQRRAGVGGADDEHARRPAGTPAPSGRAVSGGQGHPRHHKVPPRHADRGDRERRRRGDRHRRPEGRGRPGRDADARRRGVPVAADDPGEPGAGRNAREHRSRGGPRSSCWRLPPRRCWRRSAR